ncbi:MAG: UDP-2,3-diacylglucosamine diphosphatase [Spirosomataceae bacterium]
MQLTLQPHKKLYFASDFHLGSPNAASSLERERRIIAWLSAIEADAQAIFLVGDLFDFWFEYKQVVPKGFVRLLGKIAELTDKGIDVYFFTGNHDLWMRDYFIHELSVQVFHEPIELSVSASEMLTQWYIGHGDGLGPGDYGYKFLKKIFTNPVCKWLFRVLHPDVGIGLATLWSRQSRAANSKKNEEHFLGEDREFLFQYCLDVEKKAHHDYYIFGHRHLPLDLQVGPNSRYLNLGEWFSQYTYAVFDGRQVSLKKYTSTNEPI